MILLVNQFTFHYYFIIIHNYYYLLEDIYLAQQSYTVNSTENKAYVCTCMYVCNFKFLVGNGFQRALNFSGAILNYSKR